MRKIILPLANDLHVHFRQDNESMLKSVVKHTAKRCGRALVMPNTKIPVTTAEHVIRDRKKIQSYCGSMEPLMTIKVDANCTAAKIIDAVGAGTIAGKIYPEGLTTNSEGGITRDMFYNMPNQFMDVLGAMEKHEMILCLHGEMPGSESLDREKDFLFWVKNLLSQFPKLKIVLEHITTSEAVDLVLESNDNLAATITVHHLFYTLDDIIGDKLNPHAFCKPVPKLMKDRTSLRKAAISGNTKFFLGTDSAPHLKVNKECSAGCAGVYTAPVMTEFLVQLFDELDSLDKLENFMTRFGEQFYHLSRIEGKVTVENEEWVVPEVFDGIVPMGAGSVLKWKVS